MRAYWRNNKYQLNSLDPTGDRPYDRSQSIRGW